MTGYHLSANHGPVFHDPVDSWYADLVLVIKFLNFDHSFYRNKTAQKTHLQQSILKELRAKYVADTAPT